MGALRTNRRAGGRTVAARSGGGSGDRGFANSGKTAFDSLTSHRGLFVEGQKRIAEVSGVPLDKPTYVTGEQLGRAKAEHSKIKQEFKNSVEFDGIVKDVSTLDANRMKSFCQRQEHRSKTFVNQFEAKHELAQANIANRAATEMLNAATQDVADEAQAIKQSLLSNARSFQYA